jgi:hypothetical protein
MRNAVHKHVECHAGFPRSWRRILGGLLLAGVCLLRGVPNSVPSSLGDEPINRQKSIDKVKAGMAADAVRQLLRAPDRTARQILYRRYLEQWIYVNPEGLWIEWDCQKGQEPRVLSVHAPGLPQP